MNITPSSSADIIPFRLPRAHRTSEDKKKSSKPVSRASIRAAELNRLFSYQYGHATIPGIIDDVVVMLNVLATTKNPEWRMRDWLSWRAPWFQDDDALGAILRKPIWLKADAIARKIGLTAAIRKHLKIKTIGAIDMTASERRQMRVKNKIARQKQRRREAGAIPREEWEQNSLEKQKPWVTLGISRRTWFRRQKEHSATVGTDATPNDSYTPLASTSVPNWRGAPTRAARFNRQ